MNKTANYQFTIVIPVYNEEDNIYSLEKKLSEFLPQSKYTACALFVDDCSTDSSLARIKCVPAKKTFSISPYKKTAD